MDPLGPQRLSPKNTVGPGTIRRIIWSYAVFGAAWVGSSDILVFLHGGETWQDAGLSLLKGLLFVTVSAILLYVLMTNSLRDTVNERDTFRERLRNWNLDANDIVLLLDEQGRILEANDRATAAYGYTVDQLTEKTVPYASNRISAVHHSHPADWPRRQRQRERGQP
jgi:PAS domain-containing protein